MVSINWKCLRTVLKKIHHKELCNLYKSPNIVRIMKSRMLQWSGHVARIGRKQMYKKFWWEKPV